MRQRWSSFLMILSLAFVSGVGCGGGTSQMPPPPPSPPPPPETFTTTTFQQGSLLILQNQTSTDTIRIGLETAWGGSIVEVSLNGTNFVNAHDTGREVQPAFYDGNAQYDPCAGCTGVFGWDPVLGRRQVRPGYANAGTGSDFELALHHCAAVAMESR